MVLNYDIAVDLTPEFNKLLSPKFSVSLGDHGSRQYMAKILQSGEPYEIAEGSLVSIVGKKPDGHIFAYDCTYSDEYVYFTIEEQMTPVSGIVACELVIIDTDGHKLGSANFTFWVEPCPVSDGEASESDLQMFQEILDAADDLDDVREILDRAVPIAEQIGDIDKLLTAFPTEEASGSLLTLTDGADGIPAKKLTLNLVPHQSGSGDPSPENVRPISGYTAVKVTRTGKNILENGLVDATVHGVTYTKTADGNGITASGTVENQSDVRVIQQSLVLPNGTYLLSGGTEHIRLRINRYDKDDTLINRITNTGGDTSFVVDDTVGRIYVGVNPYPTGETVEGTVYPMIRPAVFSDAEYEPYTGEKYDITIPTAAGTVYGGFLVVDQDSSGTLMVGYVKHTYNGSEAWSPFSQDASTNNYRYWMVLSDCAQGANGKQVANYLKATIGSATTGSSRIITDNPASATLFTNGLRLYINTSGVLDNALDIDGWKAYLAEHNLEICYPLAEPTTYTLTAEQVTTLLGSNTVWMDADGTIDLAYRADTQMYIDSRIALLNSNLAFIEDGTTASRAYSVGQYVLIGGQLYKVTASIASGATFTIGTNVTATTVGTELTALA